MVGGALGSSWCRTSLSHVCMPCMLQPACLRCVRCGAHCSLLAGPCCCMRHDRAAPLQPTAPAGGRPAATSSRTRRRRASRTSSQCRPPTSPASCTWGTQCLPRCRCALRSREGGWVPGAGLWMLQRCRRRGWPGLAAPWLPRTSTHLQNQADGPCMCMRPSSRAAGHHGALPAHAGPAHPLAARHRCVRHRCCRRFFLQLVRLQRRCRPSPAAAADRRCRCRLPILLPLLLQTMRASPHRWWLRSSWRRRGGTGAAWGVRPLRPRCAPACRRGYVPHAAVCTA